MNHGHVLGWRLCGYSTAEGEWRSNKNDPGLLQVSSVSKATGCRLFLPVGCTEPFGIENGWLQRNLCLDIGIILGEDFLAVGVHFHPCSDPGPRQRLIVNKA